MMAAARERRCSLNDENNTEKTIVEQVKGKFCRVKLKTFNGTL